ncbi:MAG: hypothetical protein CUN56_03510 [Phototrophicales bacterium]|nr:MAG: hypothetical protein CUN56_03510 [Phototrophicales bacterium]RMG77951.1 MAG: hypothetical protein D6711_00335 [Chloroflexota bacterium]
MGAFLGVRFYAPIGNILGKGVFTMTTNNYPNLRYWLGIVLALLSIVVLFPAFIVAAITAIPLFIALITMAVILEWIRYV